MNINKNPAKKKVLVAPLDWGLGHATRCVPVIRGLLAEGFEVVLAAEKSGAALLREEFPSLEILSLPGWRVDYPAKQKYFLFKILLQLPKIFRAIQKEHSFLNKAVAEHKIDIVFSDNRFGLHHKKAHCIFMTHQLGIQTSKRLLNIFAQKINYRFINRFDECFVPDLPGKENFAGALSHPKRLPQIPVRYIGTLSRFRQKEIIRADEIVAVISGPEPLRSQFEKELTEQLTGLNAPCVIVRGLPGETTLPAFVTGNVQLINHLPSDALNDRLSSAKMIIARSGYSTIMDLAAIDRSAILIPTPGQKEQEYLAQYLSSKKYFMTTDAAHPDLCGMIKVFNEKAPASFPRTGENLLTDAIRSLK